MTTTKTTTVTLPLLGEKFSLNVIFPRGDKKRYFTATESGVYSVFGVNLVKDERYKEFMDNVFMLKKAKKIQLDASSNGGSWYIHFNGYCKDAVVSKNQNGKLYLQICTYNGYFK